MTSITETHLRTLVAHELGIDENQVTADASFKDDLGADSIDIAELAMTVEDDQHIRLTDDEVAAAMGEGTFGKLLALVEGKVAAKREAV